MGHISHWPPFDVVYKPAARLVMLKWNGATSIGDEVKNCENDRIDEM